MKRPETAKIRNIALVAHGTAGKTTLTEAVLFCAGATTRLGRVEDGTTTTDFDEDEIRRKISISTALAWAEWKGHKLNLVDTPGFAAFLTDARNALRVVDGAVVVVGAVDGVKVQTEKVWSSAAAWSFRAPSTSPRWIGSGRTSRRAVEDVRKNLSASAVPVQVPIGQEAGFIGVVDLVRMRALRFTPDGNGKPTEEDVPAAVRGARRRASGPPWSKRWPRRTIGCWKNTWRAASSPRARCARGSSGGSGSRSSSPSCAGRRPGTSA